MIEFVLKNRKLRLHPDGIMYVRSHYRGEETRTERWKSIKFYSSDNYLTCNLRLNGVRYILTEHRAIYYAHNQDWNIWDTSADNFIDHINGNRSDNRIENLRPVTHQQNQFNKTGVKGYSWHKPSQKWRSQIVVDATQIHLGMFDNEEDARNAYLEAKNTYHIIE